MPDFSMVPGIIWGTLLFVAILGAILFILWKWESFFERPMQDQNSLVIGSKEPLKLTLAMDVNQPIAKQIAIMSPDGKKRVGDVVILTNLVDDPYYQRVKVQLYNMVNRRGPEQVNIITPAIERTLGQNFKQDVVDDIGRDGEVTRVNVLTHLHVGNLWLRVTPHPTFTDSMNLTISSLVLELLAWTE